MRRGKGVKLNDLNILNSDFTYIFLKMASEEEVFVFKIRGVLTHILI